MLCYFTFTFLCSFSFLPPVVSLKCNDRQYPWPMDQPNLCCDKCTPGTYVDARSEYSCDIRCEPCTGERYTEDYNEELSCEICKNCDKTNMEYRSKCNYTHDAVCGCKAGYRFKDGSNTECEPIPTTTTKSTLPPSTTTTTALKPSVATPRVTKPIKDTAWFLVIIGLLCAGIALAVVTKIKPFLRWIKSKQGIIACLLAKEPIPPYFDSEDEEVSKPVQEVRGKCDV